MCVNSLIKHDFHFKKIYFVNRGTTVEVITLN